MLTSVTPWLFVFDQKKKELVFPVDIFEFQMCVYFKQCLHFFFNISLFVIFIKVSEWVDFFTSLACVHA